MAVGEDAVVDVEPAGLRQLDVRGDPDAMTMSRVQLGAVGKLHRAGVDESVLAGWIAVAVTRSAGHATLAV